MSTQTTLQARAIRLAHLVDLSNNGWTHVTATDVDAMEALMSTGGYRCGIDPLGRGGWALYSAKAQACIAKEQPVAPKPARSLASDFDYEAAILARQEAQLFL
tara:strand:- start:454 stop:762 length:309 start_codon:yes stop_codon:yes gene_type:complete